MRSLLVRKNSLKRLFSFGRRSADDDSPKEDGLPETEASKPTEIFPHIEPLTKPAWRCFSYEEVFEATNGFHSDNLVGQGGYAEVYRGVLKEGQVIAVKRLTRAATDEQREKEFLTELGTIGHVCHPNISCLIGCCIDNGLHLIFEFSAHGCVASRLHDEDSPPMEWKVRHKIAMGVARGLHYLHKGCQRRIIHRDIKASNVLLTADFEPQISDFGLAKWLPSQWSHHSVTPIEGTFGYLAPEYFTNGIVDEKTDVFAYGVLLLELISSRKPVDGSHQNLLSWAKPHLEQGCFEKLADPRLEGQYDEQQLQRLASAASYCIRSSAIWRPSMSEILELLVDGQIRDCWTMPAQEEDDDFWGFDDLEFDDLDGDSPLLTPPRTSTSSFR
ncbi:probable receptor-like serine/threonine-protein kinase At5g57670 [Nymphaea colorata]|nr:probable receptor-like serine/threonine-protein kinase At5g57670 [Nymphaea colorata]XP_031481455.1 probable receptor-like serine/threonine-protein kinase At5g57670 [Nymphaea colorata]XP_031481456.1 probable receptor-like serine/threonine-protein kinase At5g57670 [Nymphaea colorata]XP_031481458.1 probable receptor-like serine/threonine-protein kinase At5g57670 [Nymphaea colorata]XP_031481459.1 probable receptor-like serine/threonine-protein kinase At5g57670 [Nymphaea colorata]